VFSQSLIFTVTDIRTITVHSNFHRTNYRQQHLRQKFGDLLSLDSLRIKKARQCCTDGLSLHLHDHAQLRLVEEPGLERFRNGKYDSVAAVA
jgi:hypothetical protein